MEEWELGRGAVVMEERLSPSSKFFFEKNDGGGEAGGAGSLVKA